MHTATSTTTTTTTTMNDDELEELFAFSQYTATAATPSSSSSFSTSAGLRENSSINTIRTENNRKKSNAPTTTNSLPETLQLPPDKEEKLFDYQKEGIHWLYERHRKGRGCLLADEMGLGKTVQVSTFIGALYKHKYATSTIIIVPPTLLPIWESALLEWGCLKAPIVEVIHNDPKAKRLQRWRRLKHGTSCIFLTTYGVLRQDSVAMGVRMVDYVIMDEAHLIKDASTQTFQCAMSLSSRHRIAITGTPLMNNFEDLWSIFQFVDGSILGINRSDFRSINALLLRGNERDAIEKERCDAGRQLALIQDAIRPYMLRRDKRQVRTLEVEKRDLVVWVRLDKIQEEQYISLIDSDRVAMTCRNPDNSQSLVLLTSLMKTCDHPWLNLSDEAYREAFQSPFTHYTVDVDFGDIFSSSKISSALALVVKCINEGRKTLIFSRSKRLLDLFAIALHLWWINFARLDGDVPVETRVETMRHFNDTAGLWVCLLTTQVGGVGLTAAAASAVVLLDPSWNPSTDAQAIDRVHRIGQTRDVVVYRLITCGTVEEKVYRNQVFKGMAARQGTTAAQTEKEKEKEKKAEFYRYFTRLQLRSMFELGTRDRSETAAQLECLHPNTVSTEERAELTALPFVCDVSNNSCVHVEAVVETDDGEMEESGLSSTSRTGVKRRRQASSRSSLAKEQRQEILSQEELSDMLLQLEDNSKESYSVDESMLTYDD
ncbi:DNA excision/repair protein SNF2 [Trypanosoma theileri]|uniref:DNA excision/repair protein SNF2 n=1 Tax=Trypanosoma theileri TaxID=67003 RepID=A0A1X0P3S9_9TRYP|nr:DNA excision/repair protein SNF2 [Trypanosoma theileri]ORC91229.1 DNA excision/repair protein SNF2 [Trypanosoma theileri]